MGDIVKDLEPMLRELAEKLGTTGEYLWTITVKQAFLFGISYVGFFIFMILIGVCLVLFGIEITKRINTKEYNNRIDEAWHFAWIVPLAFVCIITFISSTVDGIRIISSFINPEYWAFKEILSQIN